MTMDETKYMQTLAWATAVLTMKMMLLHLGVVRVRLSHSLKGKFGNFDVTPEAQLEHWVGLKTGFFNLLYYSLGAFSGPYRTLNDMERFQAMERNAVENEPFFLLLAYSWTQFDMPDWAGSAIEYYVYSRLLHFVFYMFLRIQPWRAILWTVGVAINLVISFNIIASYMKSDSEL